MNESLEIKKLTKKEVDAINFTFRCQYQSTLDAIEALEVGEGLQITTPIGREPAMLRQTLATLVSKKLTVGVKMKVLGRIINVKRVM